MGDFDNITVPTRQQLIEALIPPPAPAPAVSSRWAIVNEVSPKLRVWMVGDDSPVDATPESLVSDLQVGDRVWTALTNRGSLIVVGKSGGLAAPTPPTLSSLMVPQEIPDAANLNTYTTPGLYFQPYGAWAATGSGYPAANAGFLEVLRGSIDNYMILQRYTSFNTAVGVGVRVWTRVWFSGAWDAWRLVTRSAQAWSACMSAEKALSTAGRYYSYKPSTVTTAENLSPTWATDALVIPESGMYIVTQHLGFTNDSTSGNRVGMLIKNLGVDTYGSDTIPAEAYRLAEFKAAASSDTTAVINVWTGRLAVNDKLLFIARSSQITKIGTGYRTFVTLNKLSD